MRRERERGREREREGGEIIHGSSLEHESSGEIAA